MKIWVLFIGILIIFAGKLYNVGGKNDVNNPAEGKSKRSDHFERDNYPFDSVIEIKDDFNFDLDEDFGLDEDLGAISSKEKEFGDRKRTDEFSEYYKWSSKIELSISDIEYLVSKGAITKDQAVILWKMLILKKEEQGYSLANDYYLLGFLPLYYSLTIVAGIIAVYATRILQTFFLRIEALHLYASINTIGIVLFYLASFYLEEQRVYILASLFFTYFVLYINRSVIHILLLLKIVKRREEIMIQINYNVISKKSETAEPYKPQPNSLRILFNYGLLLTIFVSCLKFSHPFASIIFYIAFGYLIYNSASFFSRKLPKYFEPSVSLFKILGGILLLVGCYMLKDHLFNFDIEKNKMDFSFFGIVTGLYLIQDNLYFYLFNQYHKLSQFYIKMEPRYTELYNSKFKLRNRELDYKGLIILIPIIINGLVMAYGFEQRIWILILGGQYGLAFTIYYFIAALEPVFFQIFLIPIILIMLLATFYIGRISDRYSQKVKLLFLISYYYVFYNIR